MPLPKPSLGESRDEFLGRCVGDDKVTSEFPDRDQRVAVCISQFEGGKMSEQQIDLEEYIEDHETKSETTFILNIRRTRTNKMRAYSQGTAQSLEIRTWVTMWS